MPDIAQICSQYYQMINRDRTDSRSRGNINVPVNLSKVKAKVVGKPTWTTLSAPNSQENQAQKVTVSRNTADLDTATVSTQKTFTWQTNVTITSDVIKGLDSQLTLELDPKFQQDLGDSVKIDMSKRKSSANPTVPIQISTGQKFEDGATASSAEVRQKVISYKGKFQCKVRLSGKVIFQEPHGNTEHRLMELCEELNNTGLQLDYTDKGGVIINLTGEFECKGDYESINWKE